MNEDCFTVYTLFTDRDIIVDLYKEAKRAHKRIDVFTDEIINKYIDLHDGDRRLTTYIGADYKYKYNLQIRRSTIKRIGDMATKYRTIKPRLIKACLLIWQMNLS